MLQFRSLLLILLFHPDLAFAESIPTKPNVIVILSDDQGWGDLSLHGNTNLKTPHLDSLANDGAQFERFYVQPVCSPTRAEFLTGRYHPRTGVRNVSTGGERLNLAEKTIADSFLAAGYRTGHFGKWHNGSQYPYHPLGRGFQEFYGFTSGHWGDYFSPSLDHNGAPVKGNGFLADDLTDRAIKFVQQRADTPFFCYLALNTPHSPMQVPDEFWERFKEKEIRLKPTDPGKEDLNHTRAAMAMVENLDWNVGRLLKHLKEQSLEKNTIIVFFHDNGPNGRRWNGEMKGIKGSTDEGGVRSPLFIRWPGKIQAGTKIASLAGAIDLLPILLDLTNIKHVGTKPLDGISHRRALYGENVPNQKREIFSHWQGRVAVRNQQYLLDYEGRLFDLIADPCQRVPIESKKPEVHQLLTQSVRDWREKVLAELPKTDQRPFPVGELKMPRTELPARDGIATGQIQRSAPAPNCSYFTNWTKASDTITWNIAVQTAGTYRIELLYACPQADVGSTIRISFGESKLNSTLKRANDPPAYGHENDRARRGSESLMKDFQRWSMGEIQLNQGEGLVQLQATAITGKQVMEVRSLVLTRIK